MHFYPIFKGSVLAESHDLEVFAPGLPDVAPGQWVQELDYPSLFVYHHLRVGPTVQTPEAWQVGALHVCSLQRCTWLSWLSAGLSYGELCCLAGEGESLDL